MVSELREGVKGGQLRILSNEDLRQIYVATLHLLEKQGVKVENEKALNILAKSGAMVDKRRKIAKIPGYMVEEAIKKAPKSIRLCGRNRNQDFILEGKRAYFGSGVGTTHIYDLYTGEYRKTRKRDVEDAFKLSDALPNIDHAWGLFSCTDVPSSVVGLHELEAGLTNTTKHICIYTWHGKPQINKQIEMAKLVAGGEEELRKRPLVTLYNEPHSPLTYGKDYLDSLMEWAKAGLPQIWYPAPMSGATSPVTMAGTLVQGWAESLGGLVIAELINPGTPFIVGTGTFLMDMKTSSIVYASAECMLLAVAIAQIAHYLDIPLFGLAGASDSQVLDGQALAESAMYLAISALAGQNLIHDLGYLASGLTGSLELLTICDEIVAMVKRIAKGIKVNDETLALGVIEKVGFGGNYLKEKHTRKHFWTEHLVPDLMNRDFHSGWVKKGGKTLEERAREKTKKLLKEHEVEPLDKEVKKKIEEIIKETTKETTKI